LNVKEAAERLEVSSATIYSLVAAGRLRCMRVGMRRGTIRILEEHIAEYRQSAESMAQRPPPPPRQVRLKHLSRA
jgi:excisionase family DNA binding protein